MTRHPSQILSQTRNQRLILSPIQMQNPTLMLSQSRNH
jgi:hypothetical protein